MNEQVSFHDIEKAIGGYGDEYKKITFGTTEETVEVQVKKRLSLADRKRLVDNVVDMCFVKGEDGNVLYCPYLKEFAIEYHLVLFFTNIELSGDVEEVYRFLAETKVARRVAMALDDGYANGLFNEVGELIEYRKNQLLKKSRFDGILDSISDVIDEFSSKFEGENGESIMKYLEENIPNFKDEIAKTLKEQQETTVINE